MLKAQNLYERLISDQIERDKKFTKGEAGIARPITGHVRSVYAQMFMNSINSADLNNIQNYLGTFMSGPCSFTLNHRVNGMYELPASLTAFSPQLFSHYLLGCFLSFPDMVVKMNGSRMYNASNGHTKIVIDTDVLCTKMFEVKFDWAPDVEQLSDVYSNMRITNRSTNTSSSQVKDDNTSGINTTTTTTTTKNKNESSSSTAVNKEDEGSIQGVVAATPTNLAAVRRLPAIPMTYVTGMSQQAKMLSAPVPLHTRGTIILYLDSNNCMQHLHVDVTQLDRLPTTDSSTTAPATNYTATASNNNMPPPVSASPPQKQRKAPVKRATKPKQQQPPTLSTGISSGISGSGNNNNSNDNNNSGIVMTGSNSA